MQRKNHNITQAPPKSATPQNLPTGIKSTPLTQLGTFSRFKSINTFHFNFDEAAEDSIPALQALHHLGTMLINSGKAYSDIKDGEPLPNAPQTDAEKAMKQRLLNIYNALPATRDTTLITEHWEPQQPSQKRAQLAEKMLHALFVIRVALDHLPEEKLFELYLKYNNQNTKGLREMLHSFADGSGLLGSYAAEQILFCYIVHNPTKFLFIPTQEFFGMMMSENGFTDYFCIGGENNREAIINILYDATPHIKEAHDCEMKERCAMK